MTDKDQKIRETLLSARKKCDDKEFADVQKWVQPHGTSLDKPNRSMDFKKNEKYLSN